MSTASVNAMQHTSGRGGLCCDVYDQSFYYQRLVQDSERVFTSEEPHIEILTRESSVNVLTNWHLRNCSG